LAVTTDERVSLAQLARKLNMEMRCPAGKNQAYVLSRLKTNGRIKKEAPQVCVDCKIRSYLGWRKRIYVDFIRLACCGDHKRLCEAYIKFMAGRRSPFISV
jgi:hypothetical protein